MAPFLHILHMDCENENCRARVMLIDDDRENLESLSWALKVDGFSVSGFHNPIKALEHFKKGSVDIVITDYKLPGLNGIELLKAMKQIKFGVQVIINCNN